MDRKAHIKIIDQRDRYIALWDKLVRNPFIRPLLHGLSFLYGFGMDLRKISYDIGLVPVKRLPFPVISVGNITVGGTGKTPVVAMIAEFLLGHGRRPVILTRGYKRRGEQKLKIVSDTKKVLSLPEEAGDEPYMLAGWLPGVPVIACKDRYASAIFAMDKFMADCFIIDDGFQHIRLFRDMDVLVINASDPFSNCKILPLGHLREPISSINRASLILLNKSFSGQNLDPIFCVIRKYNTDAPIIKTSYAPEYLVYALNNKNYIPLSNLKGKPVLAFSGIADPGSFLNNLKETGAMIVNSVIFTDHHWYSERDMNKIREIANLSGAEYIITTEKDGVRLPTDCKDGIYLLIMKMGLDKSQSDLEKTMRSILVK
ncbi:MAG: tetraacyldisaccharide 4'-kinase [bacterium]